MDVETYLQRFEADSARIADIVPRGLETAVPFLGDWTVRDLVAHVGAVYAFANANLIAQATEVTSPGSVGAAPDDEQLIAWFLERREVLQQSLRSADLAAEGWTFAGMRPGSFWVRRMAHETAVHLWDAETALGAATAMDPAMAKDGIDEYADISLRHSSSRPDRTYPDSTLHLHCTDTEGEWMFARDEDGSVVVTEEHGKGDAAVRGTAESLLLWVWGRPVAADQLQIFGDEDVAAAWRALAP